MSGCPMLVLWYVAQRFSTSLADLFIRLVHVLAQLLEVYLRTNSDGGAELSKSLLYCVVELNVGVQQIHFLVSGDCVGCGVSIGSPVRCTIPP